MTTNGSSRDEKKSRLKSAREKPRKSKSKPSEKRAGATFKTRQKSATDSHTTVIIGPGHSGKYKVYGGRGGRIPPVGSKSTASRIAGRLGVKADVFREVDRLIESLRLRKKIG